MSDEKNKGRPVSDQEAASQRAVAFRRDLDKRFREAGIEPKLDETTRWVALSAPSPSDHDVLDALQRVPLESWKRDRKKRSELDANAITALKRASARKARAEGEAPAKAGRKPREVKLAPLAVAREDREVEAVADRARLAHLAPASDLELGVEALYAADQTYDTVANEVDALARGLHEADIVAHGAEVVVYGAKRWMPERHEESPKTDQPSTDQSAPSTPEADGEDADEDDAATFDV